MKKNDIVLIIVVIFFSGIVSVVVTSLVFVPKKTKQLTAQKVDPINSNFQQPDKRFFNDKAINPTKLIQIGESNNPQPF